MCTLNRPPPCFRDGEELRRYFQGLQLLEERGSTIMLELTASLPHGLYTGVATLQPE